MARGQKVVKDEAAPVALADGEVVVPAVEEQAPAKEEARYIVRETKIPGDPYNIIRTRVKITPAVCDRCALDLVELNASRLGIDPKTPFESLSPGLQEALVQALADHQRNKHSTAEQLIVSESQLSRQWLGQKRS
jgi:hypothetical protein